MPQHSFHTKATALARRWLVHMLFINEKRILRPVVLLFCWKKRTSVTEAGKQKSYAPLESQMGEVRILEMLPDVKPSILSEGGMYP